MEAASNQECRIMAIRFLEYADRNRLSGQATFIALISWVMTWRRFKGCFPLPCSEIHSLRFLASEPETKHPAQGGVSGSAETRLASEILGYEVPVDQVPERFYKLRTRIAVVDVVGVFPDVTGQQRSVAIGHGVTGAALADDCQ